MRAHPISVGVLVLNDPPARGLARRLSSSGDEINAAAAAAAAAAEAAVQASLKGAFGEHSREYATGKYEFSTPRDAPGLPSWMVSGDAHAMSENALMILDDDGVGAGRYCWCPPSC